MTKAEAEQRIQEIRKEVAALQDEEKELKKQVIEMSRSEDTRVYLEDIYHLSEEDAMRVRLSHNMKSTPVMEKFYHSDKRFLVFQKAFYSKTAALGWIDISLVVKIGTSKVDVIDDGLTMTNLKKEITENSIHYTLYGDYYFLEGILKLTGSEFFLW